MLQSSHTEFSRLIVNQKSKEIRDEYQGKARMEIVSDLSDSKTQESSEREEKVNLWFIKMKGSEKCCLLIFIIFSTAVIYSAAS